MENCTIYSHHLKFNDIVTIITTELPKAKVQVNDQGKQKGLIATIKGGFFGKTKTLRLNYRERENPSYKLDQVECGLTKNLAGMVNFIQSLPAENDGLRNKFLIKVMSMNSEMAFMTEPGLTPEFEKVLRRVVQELDAYIFAQPGGFFKKSGAQHFVDKDFNLIIDTNGRMEVNDISVSVDAKYHDAPSDSYTDEQIARKAKSESILAGHGIKVNTNLPCVGDATNTTLRTQQDVVNRAYALMAIAAYGEGVTKEELQRPIKDKGIAHFSPMEQALLAESQLSDQQRAYATWRYESLYTMLWALNIFSELKFPNDICNVTEVVSAIFQPSRKEFTQQARLRSANEILDELDKIYRMHWACVDARIKGESVSVDINPSVIYERHYALNWLTNYQNQDWDEVQTNT